MFKTKVTISVFILIFAVAMLGFGSPAAAEEDITIGVSIPAATHGWTGGVNFWAEQTIETLEEKYDHINFVLATADGPEEQVNDLDDLVAIHDIDGLVVLPFESDPLTDPVRFVKEQGVFVTVADRGLAEEGIEDVYVAGNNPEMGYQAAEYIIDRLDGEGDIVVLRGIPTAIDDERFEAFMELVEDTDINVLDWEYAHWNRDDGYEVMQDFLIRFDEIDAVWSQDDDISLGVIEAIKEAGREDEMFVVGGAGMQQIIQRIAEGDELTPVTVDYPPAMISTAIEVTVLNYVSDAPIYGEYIIGSPLITPENAEEYIAPDSPF